MVSAVAERGMPSKSESSPKYCPEKSERRRDRVGNRAHRDVDGAVVDDVELAADVALLEHRLPGVEPLLLEALGEGREVIARQRFEERDAREELKPVHGALE